MTITLLPDTISCRMNRDYMEKSALASQVVAKTAKPLWQYVLGALGTATAMEGVQASLPGSNYTDQPAATILSRVATNMLFGGAGAHKGVTGWLGATATAPVKDIGISALANDTVGHFTEAQKTQAAKNKAEEDKSNLTAWLLGGLGLGALGLGGLALYKYWNQKDPVAAKNGARLRYRLAGDDALPGREAEVDIPISSPDITDKMLENLDSGMRRQLRKTIKLNSRKKDPITGKLGRINTASTESSYLISIRRTRPCWIWKRQVPIWQIALV